MGTRTTHRMIISGVLSTLLIGTSGCSQSPAPDAHDGPHTSAVTYASAPPSDTTAGTETIIFPVKAVNHRQDSAPPTAPFGSVPAAHSHTSAAVAPHSADAFDRAEHVAVTTLDTMEDVEFGVLEEVRAEIIGLLDTFEHSATRPTEH